VRHRKQQEAAEKLAKYYLSERIMEDESGGVWDASGGLLLETS
jgi:hypothetical protein